MVQINEDELDKYAAKLYNSINDVKIVKGVLDSDPIIWEIQITDKIIKIPAEKLESQKVFREQYIRAFNIPAPKIKREDWLIFISLLAQKALIVTDAEESEEVFIAQQVFEHIQKMPVSYDEADALIGRCLLRRKKSDVVLLKSTKVTEFIKELGFNLIANRLSPAMTKLGFKKAGTSRIRLDGVWTRVWEFPVDCFDWNRSDPDQKTTEHDEENEKVIAEESTNENFVEVVTDETDQLL